MAAAWTSDGTGYEQRGLKYRPDGAIRMVPVPPVLAVMLRAHHAAYGTAPDGQAVPGNPRRPAQRIGLRPRLARRPHAARTLALDPELAASGLARRPYDLRHAALSLWLNSGGDPAQIAARAGHSVAVLLTVYSHCIHGRDDLLNQQRSTTSSSRSLGLVRARPWKPAVTPDRATPQKPAATSTPRPRTEGSCNPVKVTRPELPIEGGILRCE